MTDAVKSAEHHGSRVFVPMSDELMNGEVAMTGELVPFDPAFLVAKEDRKPANWIQPSNLHDALARLRATDNN